MRVLHKFYDDNRLIAQAIGVEGEYEQYVRLSGSLSEYREFSVGPGSGPNDATEFTGQWVAVAVRSGMVNVKIGGANEFVVVPGKPLLYFTDGSVVQLTPGDTWLTSDGSTVFLEFATYPSDTVANPNLNNFLWLNAGRGITYGNDIEKTVSHWVDTNPSSLAPEEFVWDPDSSGSALPTLIESDPDFNGQPSVDFSEAGSDLFSYDNDDPTDLFNFLRIGGITSWTAMAVLFIPDNGTQLQTIWRTKNTSNGTTTGVEGGYRPLVTADAPTVLQTFEDEILEKPSVWLWRYDANLELLHVYVQGQWIDSIDCSAATSPSVTAGPLQLFGPTFYGKVADFQLHAESLSPERMEEYVQNAVAVYGVDDTTAATFPLVSDGFTVNYHRANRGVASDASTWTDTRPEASISYEVLTSSSDGMSYQTADEYMNDHPTLRGDGTDGYMGNANNWTHLSGAGGAGFSVMFIFWIPDRTDPYEEPLLSMSSYHSTAALSGTEIFFGQGPDQNKLEYWNNDASGAASFDEVSDYTLTTYKPWCVVVSVDAADETLRYVEYDVLLGTEVSDSTTDFDEAASSSAGAIRLLGWLSGSLEALEAGIAEFYTGERPLTDEEIAAIQAYATRRYTAPPA